MGLHLVHISGYTGLDNRHHKHDAVFDPTLGNRFRDILSTIYHSQKRIGVDKWHRVLGELCSMTIYLPGSRGLSNHMQEALRNVNGNMVTLTKGVHQALEDFLWLSQDLDQRPTRL